MPKRPPRPCAYPGCKNLTTKRAQCGKHWSKRPKTALRGYGAKWQKLRLVKLRETPLCEWCGDLAFEVHHCDRNTSNNSWDNLKALCVRCHDQIHR